MPNIEYTLRINYRQSEKLFEEKKRMKTVMFGVREIIMLDLFIPVGFLPHDMQGLLKFKLVAGSC